MRNETFEQYVRDDLKVHIYSQALLDNFSALRSLCGEGTNLCAVVKADAYGQGLRTIVEILNKANVGFFAVANVFEAVHISDLLGDAKVLILEPMHTVCKPECIKAIAENDFHCAVVAPEALKYATEVLKDTDEIINLHVKVETGMGRVGTSPAIASELIKTIDGSKNLRLAGVYTHFSTAAEKDLSFADAQLVRFQEFLKSNSLLERKDLIIHAANSAATINMPQAHFNMVRCGIAMHGWVEHSSNLEIKLTPAMKFEVPIVQINKFVKGQTIGYGRTCTAKRDTLAAIVPVGYSDNYWRLYSNRAVMKIVDSYAEVIGRISMDKTMIDITNIAGVEVGQWATVIDNDPVSRCSVYALAALADTICHEVLSSVPSKARRIIH